MSGARRSLAVECGFTLIEVVAAMFVLALVVAGASALFIHGEQSSARTVTESQLIGVANQQLETIREQVKTQGFAKLAMTSTPAHSSATPLLSNGNSVIQSNPNYFVSAASGCGPSNAGFDIEENFDNSLSGPATGVNGWSGCTNTTTFVAEPLEVLAGGLLAAGGTTTTCPADGSVDQVCREQVGGNGPTVTVYTFVTDTYVGCANNNTYASACPTVSGSGLVSGCSWPTAATASTTCADARRVTVAVVPPAPAGGQVNLRSATPVYESSIFTNPTPSNAPGGTTGLTLGIQLG